MVSQELGSDAKLSPKGQNPTPGSLQINLLFTMYAEQASGHKPMQNVYFFRRHLPSASTPIEFGGAERDRTADPLLAKQVLSQLSYSPSSSIASKHRCLKVRQQSASGTQRSIRQPSTLIRICKWWARVDLNYRPHAYQACALTN